MPSGELAYTVRRSPRARRVRVRVEATGEVLVTLPTRARAREAAAAVRELRPWIDRRLSEVQAARAAVVRPAGTMPYLGGVLELREQPERTRAHRRGDVLLVPAGDGAGAAIERWYRRAARTEIAPRVDRATAALGVRHASITIRDQRTRWGSCSPSGALAFNWRLLLGPEAVLDYVVWHEACHLVVFNHSPRFWALLERHLPGYAAPRRWLRDNGIALQP
ncbi:MAG TPA: SprT family zinc-dependent metalloprotease [Solirubrobacteraceae bacterium]|nr:SprT family zinc-dependent metalloprotease [Solirubrobacteraceae bacterium]